MDRFKKLDSIAIVPATLEIDGKKHHSVAGGFILFDSTQLTIHNVATDEQKADIKARVEKAKNATPTERRRCARLFPEWAGALFPSPPPNLRRTAGRQLDDNDDLARLYRFISDEAARGRTFPSKKRAAEAFAAAGHIPAGQVLSLRNKVTKYGEAFRLSRTIRVVRFGR